MSPLRERNRPGPLLLGDRDSPPGDAHRLALTKAAPCTVHIPHVKGWCCSTLCLCFVLCPAKHCKALLQKHHLPLPTYLPQQHHRRPTSSQHPKQSVCPDLTPSSVRLLLCPFLSQSPLHVTRHTLSTASDTSDIRLISLGTLSKTCQITSLSTSRQPTWP